MKSIYKIFIYAIVFTITFSYVTVYSFSDSYIWTNASSVEASSSTTNKVENNLEIESEAAILIDQSTGQYDISILFYNEKIQNLLNNDEELNKLIKYKGQEEKARIGGIDENTQIKNFNYLKLNFSYSLIKEFENMQNKYVLNDKYKVSIDEVKYILKQLYNKLCK